MNTGDRIRARRKALGINADDLAKKIGVSRSTIFRYENGYIEKVPSEVLNPLSEMLQTTPAYLLGIADDAEQGRGPTPQDMKRAVLFKRTRALNEKQLDIIMSIVNEMANEHDGQ